MSEIIVSLSERDIRDLERDIKLWVPINPNLDYSNLKGVAICKDSGCFTNDAKVDDSLNLHPL